MSSEAQDQEDKHLAATEQRVRKAREEGQVARSRDLVSFLLIGIASGVCVFAGADIVRQLVLVMQQGLTIEPLTARDPGLMADHLRHLVGQGILAIAPLLLALFVVGLIASVLLGGWNLTFTPILPKLSRVDPFAGFSRIFSKQGLAESAKVLAFVSVLATVLGLQVWGHRDAAAGLVELPLIAAIARVGEITLAALAALAGVMFLIAAIDIPLQWWRHSSGLRMSAEEVKRESKEADGDPQLKAKIRANQRVFAQRRMMEKVPTADVVVTNPTHYAVALSYPEASNGAPRIVAKGAGFIAQRIRELAAQHQVPTLEAPALARALYAHAELDREIPTALYQAVAQVLAWVFQLRSAQQGLEATPERPASVAVPPGMDPDEVTS